VELWIADADGQLRIELELHSLRNIQPGQLLVRQTAVVLSGATDDTSSGMQRSLKLVGDGLLGRLSENGITVAVSTLTNRWLATALTVVRAQGTV